MASERVRVTARHKWLMCCFLLIRDKLIHEIEGESFVAQHLILRWQQGDRKGKKQKKKKKSAEQGSSLGGIPEVPLLTYSDKTGMEKYVRLHKWET